MHESVDAKIASEAAYDSDAFIQSSIARLRTRLLDLTSRNPLIAFKHGGRTRRHLRVIDELPDLLYQRLSSESPMWFKSLGEEPTEPADEKTILFRRALDAAKLEDPDYLQKLKEAGAEPGEKTLIRLEMELRQRLRERLGMPSRKPAGSITAADVARGLSLDPSFELPLGTASPEVPPSAKHNDSIIQTLLFEDDLDRTLGRMRDQVRLSIDEVGVNPLFCVFGFLEWYEDVNSEVAIHGPLLLYPLQMERELVRGRYRYIVRSTGEPPVVNVALMERLKRDFQIELPPFDDEEGTPEKYMASVQKVVERQKGWRVRRWITVGLFSFARIAMYQDLDPARWESLGGLHKHPCLGQILSGEVIGLSGESPRMSDEPTPGGRNELKELELPLIADADSSQAKAIFDALSGRSFVIEGPPGTGKSQTITNIIAAALAAGKSVLFLAEKMAALNVVKDRLKEAGLDPFCLELHSTKGSRKEIFAALSARLHLAGQNGTEVELTNTLARLDEIRGQLDSTAKALAEPAGSLGITIQELLWRCQRVRKETEASPGDIDELSIPGADRFAQVDVGRIVSAAEQFEKSRAAIVKTYGSVQQHPWYGVARYDLNVFQAEDLVRRVGQLAEAAARAATSLEAVASLTGWRGAVLDDLKVVIAAASLPDPQEGTEDELIARLVDPQTFAGMEEFARDVDEHRLLVTCASAVFSDPAAVAGFSLEDLRGLCGAAGAAALGTVRASQITGIADGLEARAKRMSGISVLLGQVASRADWSAPLDLEAQQAIVAAARLAAQADARLLASRSGPLCAAGASAVLSRASAAAGALRDRRNKIAVQYALDAVADTAALRRHAAAMRGAPILPFLSLGWWRARAAHKKLLKSEGPKGRKEIAAALEEIAALEDQIVAFSSDGEVKALIGTRFNGVDSDFSLEKRVADWADRVRDELTASSEANLSLRSFLLEQPPERVELLAATAGSPLFSDLAKGVNEGSITEQACIRARTTLHSKMRRVKLRQMSPRFSITPWLF